jgi:hypothetical protein
VAGVDASVIGIIAISSYKLTRKSIGEDYLLWGIFCGVGRHYFYHGVGGPLAYSRRRIPGVVYKY